MVATRQPDSISSRVIRRIQRWGQGRVFVPRDLIDLAPDRGSIDAALHRLARSGQIRRLARGIYDTPRTHPRLGALSPDPGDLAAAIARRTGESICTSDAAAANKLGVSTQVPAQPKYLTSGATRAVRVGQRVLQLRHVSAQRLLGGDSAAGLALRAMRFVGRDALDAGVLARLRRVLDDDARAQLGRLRDQAPAWMHSFIASVMTGAESDAA